MDFGFQILFIPSLLQSLQILSQFELLCGSGGNTHNILLEIGSFKLNELRELELLFLQRKVGNAQNLFNFVPVIYLQFRIAQSLHNRHSFSEIEDQLL